MNWTDINNLNEITRRLDALGYKMGPSKYTHESIGVYPKDHENPLLTRDAQVFVGDTRDVSNWIEGIRHCMMYLSMLGIYSEEAKEKAEKREITTRAKRVLKQKIARPDSVLSKHEEEVVKIAESYNVK